jgi:hypothetical protein
VISRQKSICHTEAEMAVFIPMVKAIIMFKLGRGFMKLSMNGAFGKTQQMIEPNNRRFIFIPWRNL